MFKKISILFTTLLSIFLFCASANASVLDDNSYFYDKTSNNLTGIHNRLVDENVVGYNVYSLYNFVYEYKDSNVGWLFQDEDDFSGYLNGKFVGDYVLISGFRSDDENYDCSGIYSNNNDGLSLNALQCSLFNSFGTTFIESSKKFRSYSSFVKPFDNLSEVFGFNYKDYDELIVCDVTSFYESLDSGSLQCGCDSCLSNCKQLLMNSYIIEYISEGYDCYDNSLYLLNDGDIITPDPSISVNNTNIISKVNNEYVVYNNFDVPYNVSDIQNALSGYDCYGYSMPVLRDFEEEAKYNTYNSNNLSLEDSYLCFKCVDDFDNVGKISVKIVTLKIDYIKFFDKNNCKHLTSSYLTYDILNELILNYSGKYPSKFVGYMYDGDSSLTLFDSNSKIYNKNIVCNVFYYDDYDLKCFAFSNNLINFADFNSYKIVTYNKDSLSYNDVVSLISDSLKLSDLTLYGYAYDSCEYIFDYDSVINVSDSDVCISYYIGNDKSQIYTCVLSYQYSKDVEIVTKAKKWYQVIFDFFKKVIVWFKRLFGGWF